MRFLLHATKKTPSVARAFQNSQNSSENLVKSWGQQCSPNCGCVVRFESTLDKDNTIISASYQAKTILTFYENGQRHPHYTTNHTKPLFKECCCNTLHQLAQNIISHIKGRTLDQVVNSLSGGTSPAVVHASLKSQQLPTCHYSCYHLVQQAVVAMTCGYLPKPCPQTYTQYLQQHYASHEYYEEQDGYGIDENSGSISVIGAVNIFDMAYSSETTVEEEEQKLDEEEQAKKPKKLTWEAYVDELYHQYDDGNGQVQRSA